MHKNFDQEKRHQQKPDYRQPPKLVQTEAMTILVAMIRFNLKRRRVNYAHSFVKVLFIFSKSLSTVFAPWHIRPNRTLRQLPLETQNKRVLVVHGRAFNSQ